MSKVDQPFDETIWQEAAQLAQQYQVVLSFEDGEWFGRGLELPDVMADGPTPDACIQATREALTAAVAYMREADKRPPAPARTAQRTEQVNLRLSAEEKLRLETAAQRKGFRGLSDFIRAAALHDADSAA